MATRKRKTLCQHVVHVATPGLPKVAKNVIGSRWGARLTLAAIAATAGSGVVSVNWENGRPRATINREAVTQIGTAATKAKARIAERVEAARSGNPGAVAAVAGAAAAAETAEPAPRQRSMRFVTNRRAAAETIKIASFNIQVFGTSKAKDAQVMQILADTVRRFDLVATQELRTTDESVMQRLVDLVNSGGGAYQYIVGPRLGRTNSKEQYAFIFDSSRVEIDPSSVITIDDSNDLLHREPLVARFRTRSRSGAFTFILINIHTDPDETKTELDALGRVFQSVQRNPWREDDVILLGDLNVSHKKLGLLGAVPDVTYTVHGEPTNTRGNKSYDNIVFSRIATSEYTGQAGVLNVMTEYGLTMQQALKVSDHFPVWAEFEATEAGASHQVASRRPQADPVPASSRPQQPPAASPSPATPMLSRSTPEPQPVEASSPEPTARRRRLNFRRLLPRR